MTSVSRFNPQCEGRAFVEPAPGPGRRWYAVCVADRAGGLASAGVDHVDPLLVRSGPFIERLNRLQQRFLEPAGLGIPAWALYDCAEVTGMVAGARTLGDDPEPITMLAATPMLIPGHWHFFGLCASDDAERLATVAILVALLRPVAFTAVLGWADPAWSAYERLGPVEILTAWTPAHTRVASATIRVEPGPPRPHAHDDTPGERLDLDTSDERALRRLQARIDLGARVYPVGPVAAGRAAALKAVFG